MDRFQKAYEFSHNWFRGESGEDVFETDGISFGVIPQVYVYQKYLDLLSRQDCRLTASREGFVRWLKEHHLDWPVRNIGSRVYGLLARQPAPTGCGSYLFVYDVHNRGMIESLVRVEDKVLESADTTALTFEPRVFESLRKAGKRRNVLLFSSGMHGKRVEARRLFRKLLGAYRQNRARVSARIGEALPLNLQPAMLRWLDNLAGRFYRDLANDYVQIEKLLHECRPECMIAASDSHRFSRMMMLMARRDGTRTLVVQHGATVSPHAYVPVYADRIAVWGEISREWFLGRGVADDKITITGQPRLDDLPSVSINRHASSDDKTVEQVLVLATNPIGAAANEEVWNTVNAAIERVGFAGRLVLKLHPGQSDRDLFCGLAGASRLHWEVAGSQTNLHSLIASATAVITTQSTVGIEALGLNCPLVVVRARGIQQAIPYEKYGCTFEVSSVGELADALSAILTGSQEMQIRRSNARRFVSDYLYRLDGKAASRIASLVTEGALPKDN